MFLNVHIAAQSLRTQWGTQSFSEITFANIHMADHCPCNSLTSNSFYMRAHTRSRKHARTHSLTRTCEHTLAHANMRAHTRSRKHARTHSLTQTCVLQLAVCPLHWSAYTEPHVEL